MIILGVIDQYLFSCQFCSKVLTTPHGIKHHEETVHLNRAKFRCRMCDLSFSTNSNRMRHEKNICKSRPSEHIDPNNCDYGGDVFVRIVE